jgi:transposase
LLNVRIAHHCERWRQRRRGRPGKRGRYRYRCRVSYSLHWTRDAAALRAEARTDGVFPLLCTDPTLPAKSVLQAYKFQPRLEKRFCQFKSIHGAAPLLFKKIHRVEANMFVFFVALMVQALLERHLRQRLAQRSAPPLKLYPEDRDAPHPTTSQLLKTFEGLSTYAIIQDGRPVEEYRDQLSDTHRTVLALMDMTEEQFWAPN